MLGGLVKISRAQGNSVVSHYNIQPTIDLYATTQDRDLGSVAREVQKVIDANKQHLPRGATVTLRGQGVPRLRGGGRGDLVVQVVVETPTRVDDEQRVLLEQLAALRGEEQPGTRLGTPHKGVFGRLKDAFR